MAKTAFLFSGQGAQYTGMAKELYDTFPVAREIFSIANKVLHRNIDELCFYASSEELSLTENTQPAVLATELAIHAVIKSFSIFPNYVAGFSLGEYAALVAGEVISVEESFKIIDVRAKAMQSAVPAGQGSMLSILGCSIEDAQEICRLADSSSVFLANYNCPGQVVLSGTTNAVEKAAILAEEKKMMVVRLSVSAPFHTTFMQPAAETLKNFFEDIHFSDSSIPIYMNVDGNPEQIGEKIADKMIMQTVSPVRWEQTIRNLYNDGVETFIEIGPGKSLSKLLKRTIKGVSCFNVDDISTLKQVRELFSI